MKKTFLTFFCFIACGESLPKVAPKIFDDGVCRNQLALFTDALSNREFWAIHLFDTWAKLQSGFLAFNFQNLGNFDHCLRFQHNTQSSGIIQGQYCLVNIRAAENSTLEGNPNGFDWREL